MFCNKLTQAQSDTLGPTGPATAYDLGSWPHVEIGTLFTHGVVPTGFLSIGQDWNEPFSSHATVHLSSSDDTTDGSDGTWEDEGYINLYNRNDAVHIPRANGTIIPKVIKGIGIVITNSGTSRRYLVSNQEAIDNLHYDRISKHVMVFADETERDNHTGNTDILAVVKTVSNGTSPSLQLYDHANNTWEVL